MQRGLYPIGKVEIIAWAVSDMASYNIRLLPIIQSMAQLNATYGEQVAQQRHKPAFCCDNRLAA